jgi:hypothetical protein
MTTLKPAPKLTGLEFTGSWIGETMGHDSPAHLWEIERSNDSLIIKTRWETEQTHSGYFTIHNVPREKAAFTIKMATHTFTGVLVDSQHFIIRGWDTNDVRGGKGPHYDVVFSRPGVAELTARAVWLQHKGAVPKAKPERAHTATATRTRPPKATVKSQVKAKAKK